MTETLLPGACWVDAGLTVRVERVVLVGFTVGSTSAPLWPQELAASTPSSVSLTDVRILLPKSQMDSWIQYFTAQGSPPSIQTVSSPATASGRRHPQPVAAVQRHVQM
jgi:hypothetical protein